MSKFPVKRVGQPGLRPYSPSDPLARGGAESPGTATISRIVELLIQATSEGKIHWFRDAEYFAVTYFPMLAASFRLQVSGPLQMGVGAFEGSRESFDASKAMHMTIAFMDNKEFKCLASQYPILNQLSELVWSTFKNPYRRDVNERLEWLEKALRIFLPHVISSSVEPEDQ